MGLAVKVKCPHCSVVIRIPEGWERPKYVCPGCKQEASMPTAIGPEPPPLPPPLALPLETATRRRWNPILKWTLIAIGVHLLFVVELAAVAAIFRYSPANREIRKEIDTKKEMEEF